MILAITSYQWVFAPSVAAMWRPFRRLAGIETVLLVPAVVDMALKPGA